MNPFGYNLKSRCKNRAKRFSNRPVSRNSDAFGYNERSEVIFSRGDAKNAEYSYDEIGNLLKHHSSASITNQYVANNLNQYATILRDSATPREINPQCDIDGNLLSDGTYSFTYDSANRLKTVSSIKYYWGKDLSGSLQGAGGVGADAFVDGVRCLLADAACLSRRYA